MVLNKSKHQEIQVFNILEEYMQKSPNSSVSDLFEFLEQYIKLEPNINSYKFKKIIKDLYRKERVLQNSLRKRMYDLIRINPGINFNELQKICKIGTNQASWHLNCLEKFQYIKSETIGNQKAFFKYSIKSTDLDIFFYLRKEKIKHIINLLKENNAQLGLNPSYMSKQLNMHYNTIRKYLTILLELKLITKLKFKNQYKIILDFNTYNEKLSLSKDYFREIRREDVQDFVLAL